MAVPTGLSNNDTYYWQVRAINATGTIEADDGTWWSYTARGQTFSDIPVDHSLWPYVEAVNNAGIITGCGVDPMIYCPERHLTRAEMAVFLERAMHYPNLPYIPPSLNRFFFDMPVVGKEWMQDWADEFYRDGLTAGCGRDPLVFCPERPVTRAEAAFFFLRAIHGPGYWPPAAGHFFGDVPVSGMEWAEPWIDQLYREGIASGCGEEPLMYCPKEVVTLAEMAALITRAFHLPLP